MIKIILILLLGLGITYVFILDEVAKNDLNALADELLNKEVENPTFDMPTDSEPMIAEQEEIVEQEETAEQVETTEQTVPEPQIDEVPQETEPVTVISDEPEESLSTVDAAFNELGKE